MVQLNFNAQQVAPNASLESLPSGVYDVVITNSVEKPTSKGNGLYIEFEMTVRSPDQSLNGRKVFDRLNIKNESQQAVDIAYGTLSAICHVTGRHQIADTSQLHGIPFKAVVSKVARADRPGEFSNDVKGYKDAQGNDPGSAGATRGGPPAGPQGGAPQQAAPQQGYPQQQPAPQQGYNTGQPAPNQDGAPSWAGQQPASGLNGNGGGYGGQPTGYQDYQGQGAPQGVPQGVPPAGQGYGNVPNPNGQQVGGPAPGYQQQTSEQHVANGPQQGAPQGGYPQQQPAPNQGQPPAAAAPGLGQAPPWVQPQS